MPVFVCKEIVAQEMSVSVYMEIVTKEMTV